MRPAKRMFWLPLARLGAFFGGVVIAGNAVCHAFRPAAASPPQDPAESVDHLPRRIKRLERHFFRLLDRFLGAPASAATTDQEKLAVAVPGPALEQFPTSKRDRILHAGRAIERLGILEPEVAPFAWPPPLGGSSRPEVPLPNSMGFLDEQDFRAELVTDLYRRCGPDLPADIGDALLRGPEIIFDGMSSCMGGLWGRSPLRTWEEEETQSVTERMLYIQPALRDRRIFSIFMQQWMERERKYLGAFEDESRASTPAFQDRTEGADTDELKNDQRKIVLDALRRTYFARYRMHSEDPLPEEAWECRHWNGFDFAVLPPLIGGLLYYRGINKRISMGETMLRISFEPASEFVHRKHDRSVMAALEWTVKGFPVGVIVSAGRHDGRYGLDFVGIGTSIGAARRAVENQDDDGRR
jgi:hypothetical protein